MTLIWKEQIEKWLATKLNDEFTIFYQKITICKNIQHSKKFILSNIFKMLNKSTILVVQNWSKKFDLFMLIFLNLHSGTEVVNRICAIGKIRQQCAHHRVDLDRRPSSKEIVI